MYLEYRIEDFDRLKKQLESNTYFKNIMGGNEPSDEQYRIFDAILNDKLSRNIRVNAVAGSGKSSTIRGCIALIPPDKRILVVAHNRVVRDDIFAKLLKSGRLVANKTERERRRGYKEATEVRYILKKDDNGKTITPIMVQTFHGLGYGTIGKTFGWGGGVVDIIQDNKYDDYFDENIVSLVPPDYDGWKKGVKRKYRRNVFAILDYARINLCQTEREIEKKVIDKYGINPISNEISAVKKMMDWGMESAKEERIDFTDCVWIPAESEVCKNIYFKGNPKDTYDYVFVDEAQDMSPAQLAMIIKANNSRKTRVILMGDSDQAINMWCGSMTDALSTACRKINGNGWIDFDLTINFRCGKKIIEFANNILDNYHKKEGKRLKPKDNAVDGVVQYNAKLSDIQSGDLVLARFTSTIFELFARLIRMGKKAVIRGESQFINDFKELVSTDTDSIADIIQNAKENFALEWKKATKNDDYRESMHNTQVINCYMLIKALESLSTVASTKSQLNALLNASVISENDEKQEKQNHNDYIELSTIHRAKGHEADNVYIACPSVLYSPLIDEKSKEWERVSEENLQYVAYTRAAKKMAFIDEKEIYTTMRMTNKENLLYKDMVKIMEELG